MSILLNFIPIVLAILCVVLSPLWVYDAIVEFFTGRKPYE
jgi:hypothetical protein